MTSSRLDWGSGKLKGRGGKDDWRNIGQGTESPACWLGHVSRMSTLLGKMA